MLTKGHNIRNTGRTHFKKGHAGYWLGKHPKPSVESIAKRSGEKSVDWKGDSVGYRALHHWIEKKKGRPSTCEHCGKSGLTGKKIHWANRSHKYLRLLDDWLRLCVPCHYKYDHATN